MGSTSVLLAGATGMLATRIAHHLLDDENVALRLLVRPSALADSAKRSALDPLVERAAAVVAGDVANPASLGPGLGGADTVDSALEGGRAVTVDGEIVLARAAARHGVPRIVPSDFALDNLQNDRYPDLAPVTLAELPAQQVA